MHPHNTIKEIKLISLELRELVIRLAEEQDFGVHLGGGLSLAEILAVLYFGVAHLDPKNPDWPGRDRIVLSKGHGNIALLATLALRGYFPLEVFHQFNQLGSIYSMHADARVAGVEHSAGSLGHGLSVAVGMALAGRLDRQSWQVYCLLGDGESMEGSVWEAMLSAAHYKLNNLTAVIDRNHLTQEGYTERTMALEPLAEKCRSFGWQTLEVDGHAVQALLEAFQAPRDGRPKMLIASTQKAHGVPAYQGQIKSHFAHLTSDQATAALALIQLERQQLREG